MRLKTHGLLFFFLLGVPGAAFGDTLFSLHGALEDGTGTFNGTIRYSSQGAAKVTGTVTDGSFSFTLPDNYLGEQLGFPTYSLVDVFPVLPPIFDLYLVVPNAVLAGDAGGALCTLRNYCPGAGVSEFSEATFPEQRFLTLTATPVSATPELGTLTLLGTGLLGLVGVARRRMVR